MAPSVPLRIGITCYPSVGGSGVLASALGENLAQRGHDVHFIGYERPFRLPSNRPRIHFHPVIINDYDLFKYPDYTLPLSVKMAEVSREQQLDILHVHYAVPHATAAILARSMLPASQRPKVVTTLHGTDTTLLGRDAGYGPAIKHALDCSDAVTVVSEFLKTESRRLLDFQGPLDVIYNFFEPRLPERSRAEVRREVGVRADQVLILHSSNLRPLKRIDVLLDTAARIRPEGAFKLVILGAGDFTPFESEVRRLGLSDRIVVRQNVNLIEDYLQAADLGLITSDTESFCLTILEAMFFGCPSVATNVGGLPEVIEDGISGLLAPAGRSDAISSTVERLIQSPELRARLGQEAKQRAMKLFRAEAIVPQYEALYRRVADR